MKTKLKMLWIIAALLLVCTCDNSWIIDITDPLVDDAFQFTYNIGETGPGGGIIFYRSAKGFTMTDNGQKCHYLEAATADVGSRVWSSLATPPSGMGDTIGTGRKNTSDILSMEPTAPAALQCSIYSSGGGYFDWFLPSKDELYQLYENRAIIGITTGRYWSSSDYPPPPGDACCLDFSSGTGSWIPGIKNYAELVRPIRAF